jgi:segregation and condensation protein B
MDLDYKNIIESLLFASDTPLSLQKLKEITEVDSVKKVRKGIDDLNNFYDEKKSAMKVVEVAGGFQIVSRPEYAPYVQRLFKGRQASRLTQRGLETLAIIAYKQPITKNEMENIRGVNVDGVVKTLLERNLIKIEGREKAPGNPLLYGTTKYFLEYFGLKSLEDLPKLKEIDELLKDDTKFLESLDQVALQKLEPEALGLTNISKSTDSEENNMEDSENTSIDEHGQISLETKVEEKNDAPE